jgi:hypothetical protein
MSNQLATAAAELLRSAGYIEQPDGSWQPTAQPRDGADSDKHELCDDIARPGDVAEVLHTSLQGLANMRHRGTGPRYIKRGKFVLYRWSDVRQYLETNTHRSTADRNAGAETAGAP